MHIATELIRNGYELAIEEMADLRQRYSADELSREIAVYLHNISEGKQQRRPGRPRARRPAIEFHRRVGAVADYHLFLREERQHDALH